MISPRAWLLIGTLGLTAHAQPPAPPTQPPGAAAPAVTQPPASATGAAPDEGLIEFLGSDDVGDAAWWEFLKRAPSGGKNPPPPPPQDVNK